MIADGNAALPGLTALFLCASLAACDEGSQQRAAPASANEAAPPAASTRWYTAAQQAQGESLFADHCAVCHGDQGQGGSDDWRERLPDGSFPPPPLNGTAHTWHHPLPVLLRVIAYGGANLGGKMPAFDGILSESDSLAIVAWFQSLWSDDIYEQWQQMGGVN